MNKRKTSRAALFLIELMIVILLFALCAAVCLSLFSTARQMSDDSDDLNHAVAIAKTAAGCYKAGDGDLAEMCRLMNVPDAVLSDSAAVIYYDANWEPVPELCDDGYYLQAANRMDDAYIDDIVLRRADLAVCHEQGEPIFVLTVQKTITYAGGELHAP